MKRRALLTSMGAGMAGLAGCLTGNSNSGGQTPSGDVGTPVAVSTPEGSKANFQLTGSISASGTAEVGQEYEFEITVENTGGQPGVYRAPAKTRVGDEVGYTTRTNAMVYVEPGATKTATVSLPAFESVGSADVRFDVPENTWSVDIIGPDLPMGETFEVDGFEIAFESVEFRESVTYDTGSFEQEYTPGGSDAKLAVAVARVESVDSSSWMANSEDYTLVIDGNRRSALTDAGYTKRSLADGQTQRVEFPYEVPGDTTSSNVILRYDGVREEKYARWSPGFSSDTSGDGSGEGSDADGSDGGAEGDSSDGSE